MTNYYHVLPAWQLASQEELAAVIETLRTQRSVCKLHIGAGQNSLSDWLNTDIYPSKAYIYYLDAQHTFPIVDKRVQYIFCEHTIEHIPLNSGDAMLRECYRVLADGGKIRLATPDLETFCPSTSRRIETRSNTKAGLNASTVSRTTRAWSVG